MDRMKKMRLVSARAMCIAAFMAAALLAACERQADVETTQQPVAPIATPAPAALSASEPPTAVPASMPTHTATLAVSPKSLPFNSVSAKDTITAMPESMPEDPPVRDLFALAQRYGRADAGGAPLTRTLPPDPNCCKEGHRKRFFVADRIGRRVYTVEARLLAVSENAYWYADEQTDLTAQELEQTANVFEKEIRPRIVEAIGDIWKPGVDGDPRLTVLHTPLVAAAGYFSASDSYPRATHPRSNEREMIVMDGDWLRPGSQKYFAVLAHEFQHAVHWNLDLGEDAWVNEGMSEVATEIAGLGASFVGAFLEQPEAQLNFWPDAPQNTLPHYGGAALFVEYLAEHYGAENALSELASEPLDGVNGVERYLSRYEAGFVDVFADWAVANYLDARLDELDGADYAELDAYRYSKRSVGVQAVTRIDNDYEEAATQPQLSARYYELRFSQGSALVEFAGDERVKQVDTECRSGRYCWWGGNGDIIDTTLEREFDLSGVDAATLEFRMWHEIEEDWDYAYASVSTDGGKTWATLDGEHTAREDPLGANYGAGLTGNSGGGESGEWVRERMDLSKYAGLESVLLRFEYITDDAVNIDGIVIDDIAIPEIGFADDAETDGEWLANGFQRIDNSLPQGFALRLIEFAADGSASISEPPRHSFGIGGFGERLDYAVLVVAPTTHATYQPAGYSLRVEVRQ